MPEDRKKIASLPVVVLVHVCEAIVWLHEPDRDLCDGDTGALDSV